MTLCSYEMKFPLAAVEPCPLFLSRTQFSWLSRIVLTWTLQGRIVALDKSRNKLAKVTENIQRWGVDCVEVYNCDATKALDHSAGW